MQRSRCRHVAMLAGAGPPRDPCWAGRRRQLFSMCMRTVISFSFNSIDRENLHRKTQIGEFRRTGRPFARRNRSVVQEAVDSISSLLRNSNGPVIDQIVRPYAGVTRFSDGPGPIRVTFSAQNTLIELLSFVCGEMRPLASIVCGAALCCISRADSIVTTLFSTATCGGQALSITTSYLNCSLSPSTPDGMRITAGCINATTYTVALYKSDDSSCGGEPVFEKLEVLAEGCAAPWPTADWLHAPSGSRVCVPGNSGWNPPQTRYLEEQFTAATSCALTPTAAPWSRSWTLTNVCVNSDDESRQASTQLTSNGTAAVYDSYPGGGCTGVPSSSVVAPLGCSIMGRNHGVNRTLHR